MKFMKNKYISCLLSLVVLLAFRLYSQDLPSLNSEGNINFLAENNSSIKSLDQYTLDDLLDAQLILLDIYNVDNETSYEDANQRSDEFIFDSLAEISYKIASIFFQNYSQSQNLDDVFNAIPHIELATEIRPNNFAHQLFKGNLFYLVKKFDSYFIDAIIAYEMSGELIFESKQSFLALVELYLHQRLPDEANDLFLKMVSIDPDWVFSNAFDLFLTAFLASNERQIQLTDFKELENKYTIQYPQIYLTQAIIYSSLNDLDSLEEAFNKYKAAKTFKEISGMEEKEQALTSYITSRKASNG